MLILTYVIVQYFYGQAKLLKMIYLKANPTGVINHLLYQGLQQALQERSPIDLEAERHNLAAQGVAPEQGLHAVRHLHLAVEHVPQQRGQQVLGVEQGDKDAGQLVHLVRGHHVGQGDGNG